MNVQLTPRQREILRRVVEEYVATGQPVGSKGLVERAELDVSPSTVRTELAELEGLGLLTHPHTSAGRVPTDRGYRLYADDVLDKLEPRSTAGPLIEAPAVRNELEAVMQQATEMLADATHRAGRVARRGDEREQARRASRPARCVTSRCCCCSRRWRWSC